MTIRGCEHIPATLPELPAQPRCDACVAMGDAWVHLRMCLHCGSVGCCDDSKNRHASRHARNAQHPVMRSAAPGELAVVLRRRAASRLMAGLGWEELP